MRILESLRVKVTGTGRQCCECFSCLQLFRLFQVLKEGCEERTGTQAGYKHCTVLPRAS